MPTDGGGVQFHNRGGNFAARANNTFADNRWIFENAECGRGRADHSIRRADKRRTFGNTVADNTDGTEALAGELGQYAVTITDDWEWPPLGIIMAADRNSDDRGNDFGI